MDDHATDMSGGGQAQVAPAAAVVVGTVHAVAVRDIAPNAGLARAGVNDLRMRISDGRRPAPAGRSRPRVARPDGQRPARRSTAPARARRTRTPGRRYADTFRQPPGPLARS